MLSMGVVVIIISPPTCTVHIITLSHVTPWVSGHLISVNVVAHHPQTESPVPVQTHGPVDQVKHHEHDRKHNQEHVINLGPEM